MREVYVSRNRPVPQDSLEYGQIREIFKGDQKRFECYTACMNEVWDLRDESVCASTCAL